VADPEHDVMVEIIPLEDASIRACDRPPIRGQRRYWLSSVRNGGAAVRDGCERGVDLLAGEVPAVCRVLTLQLTTWFRRAM
jgi:hypothetical protein